MTWWFGALLVLAWWLLARPYAGLRHDGVLYLGQALQHIDPALYGADVFFAFGSQDRFTLLARLLALAYAVWDVATVQIVLLSSCHAALLAALWRLLAPIGDPFLRWLGLAAVAVLSHVYGGWGLFAFAERFVTGRAVAEPLALFALVALLAHRRGLAALLLLAAGLMHPLMALPMAVVMACCLVLEDRRWAWAAGLAVIPLLLALGGIAPFTGLLQRFDDAWWQHVLRANGAVLLSTWRSSDWQIVAMDLLVLATAARMFPAPLSRACIALSAAFVLLFAATATGADLGRNVLLTQLQLWRVQGYAHMVALALLPALFWRCWQRPAHGPLLALALAAFVVAVNARWDAGWVFLAWVAVCAWLTHARPPLSAALQRAMLAATALALLGLTLAALAESAKLIAPDVDAMDGATVLLLAFTTPLLALPLAAGLLEAWRRGGRVAAMAAVSVVVLAATAVAQWDRRSAWTRHIETALPQAHPWATLIPPTAEVYWHGDLAATWVLLKRRSYVSDDQGAGSLFNRGTALEVARRREVFAALRMQYEICAMQAALNQALEAAPESAAASEPCVPTAEVLRHTCRAEKGPDFLVFETRVEAGRVAQWTFAGDPSRPRTFHLYDCLQLR